MPLPAVSVVSAPTGSIRGWSIATPPNVSTSSHAPNGATGSRRITRRVRGSGSSCGRRPRVAPRPTYEEQVLEALAVGWIDGQAKTVDDERTMMWFTRRTPKSPWSASNKQRVEQLESEGLMQPAGRAAIDAAKANGMWNVFDDAERLIEPAELAILLDVDPTARANWNAYPPSVRRSALSWIALAARDETKSQRIASIVSDASKGQRRPAPVAASGSTAP